MSLLLARSRLKRYGTRSGELDKLREERSFAWLSQQNAFRQWLEARSCRSLAFLLLRPVLIRSPQRRCRVANGPWLRCWSSPP